MLKLPIVFNKDEYELINFGNQQILFEKGTLKIHTISNQFYEVLSFFENPKIVENLKFSNFSVSEQAIRELIERKILISST